MTEIASEAREPTKAEREKAEAVYLAWCARGGWDWRDLVVKALAAASDAMKERAAKVCEERIAGWSSSAAACAEAKLLAAAIRALEPGEGTT